MEVALWHMVVEPVMVKDGKGLIETAIEPVILPEHPVAVLVAITVYVPAPGWFPKEIALPVPATAEPVFTPPI